jgi:hypothetical protein
MDQLKMYSITTKALQMIKTLQTYLTIIAIITKARKHLTQNLRKAAESYPWHQGLCNPW